MYTPAKRAYAIAIWGVAAICGPVLGPLVGSFAAAFEDWRWTIWELTWLSAFAWVFLFFLLPETSSANILYRRSRRLRQITGDEKLKTEAVVQSEGMKKMDIVKMSLIRPITLSFLEPIVFLLNLYIALIYALLYCWVSCSSSFKFAQLDTDDSSSSNPFPLSSMKSMAGHYRQEVWPILVS